MKSQRAFESAGIAIVAAAVWMLGCVPSTPAAAPTPAATASARSVQPPTAIDVADDGVTLPNVTIRPQSADEAFEYLWRTLLDMPFFREHGYQVALPEHAAFQKRATGELETSDVDRQQLRELFVGEIYDAGDFHEALEKLVDVGPILLRAARAFKRYNELWGFKLFGQYDVLLTLYGPGGSYDPDTGTIVLFTTNDGRFKKPPAHTIVHEMVHIGIEELIVQRFELSHWEKERVVDRVCWLEFGDVLPDYAIQKQGVAAIDPFVTKEALLDLPKAIERYVKAHPRK